MEFFLTRRKLVGQPAGQSSHLASVHKGKGEYEERLLSPEKWARAVFAQSDNDEVLIFVHGYNTSHAMFTNRLRRTRKGARKAGFKGDVIGFEWPSLNQLLSYADDKAIAKSHGPALVTDCIDVLKACKPTARIHIIAHSMGTLATVWGFEQAGRGRKLVDEMVFVASDVARKDMGADKAAGKVLKPVCDRLTCYCSHEDEVLDMSQKLFNNNKKRCGQYGMDPSRPARFSDVHCADRFKHFVPSHKQTSEKSHNWHFEDPHFFDDLAQVLSGKPQDKVSTRTASGNDSYIMTKGVA